MIFSALTIPLVLIFFAFYIYVRFLGKSDESKRKFPKGPVGLPFIGCFLEFRRSPLKAMTRWRKKYGNIVGLRIGSYQVLLLSDVELLKEAFNNATFNARPGMKPMLAFSGGSDHGTLTSTTQTQWDELRKFQLKELHAVGFGERSTEEEQLHNLKYIIEYLSGLETSICLHDTLYGPVAKYIWHMLTGTNLSLEHTLQLQNALMEFKDPMFVPIATAFWMIPEVVDFFPGWTGYDITAEKADVLHSLIKSFLDRVRAEWRENGELGMLTSNQVPKNFLEACVIAMWKNKDNPSSGFHANAGENNVVGNVMNIFSTGVISLANVLNWAFSFLAAQPIRQDKIHAEIIEIMGSGCDRDVKLDDMKNMPYTVAFMKEVFRISSSAPFANFHETTANVQFRGYWIPKGTMVIGNLYGANHDEGVWTDPEEFRPERFLVEDQDSVPAFLSFSVGLRTCPAQVFTRNSFFLYLITIVQNFRLTFDTTVNPVWTDSEICEDSLVSIFRFAKPYNFDLVKRDNFECGNN